MIKFSSTTFLIILLLLSRLNSFSQVNYSELALTGRGDLELAGTQDKLQKEVFEAFKKMQQAALKDSISIKIASAYRSFDRQQEIWNRKYEAYISEELTPQEAIEKIIAYSTIPGTSRHHWGTDIDLIEEVVKLPERLLIEENYINNGIFSNFKKWMDKNSEKYGFYLVYDDTVSRRGFKYEPWHYSYKKLSYPMLKEFLKVDLIKLLQSVNLKGNKFITPVFLQKYTNENVLDINPKLK
ncbi:M15 family metallopeptidase [Lutibacter sp.]